MVPPRCAEEGDSEEDIKKVLSQCYRNVHGSLPAPQQSVASSGMWLSSCVVIPSA